MMNQVKLFIFIDSFTVIFLPCSPRLGKHTAVEGTIVAFITQRIPTNCDVTRYKFALFQGLRPFHWSAHNALLLTGGCTQATIVGHQQ